jgi:hypothetical protein
VTLHPRGLRAVYWTVGLGTLAPFSRRWAEVRARYGGGLEHGGSGTSGTCALSSPGCRVSVPGADGVRRHPERSSARISSVGNG